MSICWPSSRTKKSRPACSHVRKSGDDMLLTPGLGGRCPLSRMCSEIVTKAVVSICFSVTQSQREYTSFDSRHPSKVGALEAVEGHVCSCFLWQQRQQRDSGPGEESFAANNMARWGTTRARRVGHSAHATRPCVGSRAHALPRNRRPADARLHQRHRDAERDVSHHCLYVAE